MKARDIDTLVTGATGFIGRWLLIALTARGRRVAALVRNADERGEALRRFVAERGGEPSRLLVVEGDVTRADLGLREALPGVRDVYHLAARMAFGLTREEAFEANVMGTLHTLRWAAAQPRLRRFVELGGYRMTRAPGWLQSAPDEADRRRLYRTYGAYEASKYEAHASLQAEAAALGVPVTSVHPSGVIGDSRTGECTQTDGLAETVEALWRGKLRALAGSDRTFVPLVAVDYLAAFLATVVEREALVGASLVVLDEATPNLPELVAAMAAHLGVEAPRRVLPLSVVQRLPAAVTGLHPEAVGFLSEDRYDVTAAKEHAAAVGLVMPPWRQVLQRWLDHLVATRFLRQEGQGTLRRVAGAPIFVSGDPRTAPAVFLHGVPFNGDSWRAVRDALPADTCTVDLPGLGRSAPAEDDLAVLHTLLADRPEPVTLVAHSLGTSLALRYAVAHPGRVRRLVLISPFFLQAPSPWWMRWPPATALVLALGSEAGLARQLLGSTASGGQAVASARDDLRRGRVARRTAEALAWATRSDVRRELVEVFDQVGTPVTLVVGSCDPLLGATDAETLVIDGAGHSPQVSHPEVVAEIVGQLRKPDQGTQFIGVSGVVAS